MLKSFVQSMIFGVGILAIAGHVSAQHKIDAKQLIEKLSESNPDSKRILETQPELAEKLTQFSSELPPDLNQDLVLRTVAHGLARYEMHGDFNRLFNYLERELRIQRSRSFPNLADIPISKMNNAPLTSQEQKTLMAILEDFQVNENAGGAVQYFPDIGVANNGDFVICWEDYRNGKWDIYAQRFGSDGVAQGANFYVNDDIGNAEHRYPAIDVAGDGSFVICWQDDRNGNFYSDIYAQRFGSDGMALGANFRVNDDAGSASQFRPGIGVAVNGNFVISWEDERNGNSNIYAQRFGSDGLARGVNFRVNDVVGGVWNPAISVASSGNFVICWEDQRNGNYDIYAQRFDNDGVAQGVNFRVNDDATGSRQSSPSVGLAINSNFVICWQDNRNVNWDNDIYAQRFGNDGVAQGANFRVDDAPGIVFQYEPAIGVDSNGNFVICWRDERNDDYDIYAQRYSSDGLAQDANFRVNDDSVNSWQGDPAIDVDSSGNFVICWEDNRNGDYDIYTQRFASDGLAQGANFQGNDDTGSASQYRSSVGVDGSGNFLICWEDYRNGDGDIYAQHFGSDGMMQGANFRVNDNPGSTQQQNPALTVAVSGDFVVCWEDYRNGNWDIYAQRFGSDGAAQGANFRVNDDGGNTGQFGQAIGIASNGNFVICWEDYRNGNKDIYAQSFSSDGVAQGANFRVNDDAGNVWQDDPGIGVAVNGDFVICWDDSRNGNHDIYAQRFGSDGLARGVNFRVNDDGSSASQGDPAIGIAGDNSFVICWIDNRISYYFYDIYAQRFGSDGVAQGANFRVNDDIDYTWQRRPAIGVASNGNFVISWEDERNGNSDIYAQRYDANGVQIENNYLVNNDAGVASQQYPAIAFSQAKIYFTWQDNRIHGQGWDIFARVEAFDGAAATDLLSPAEGSIITTDPITFTWSDVGAVRYELYVDNNPGLGSPEISPFHIDTLKNYSDTTYTISGNWLQQNEYYWKVVAFFPQDTLESGIGQFTYQPPTLSAPDWGPLYRLYHPTDKDHFYAASEAHRQTAIQSGFLDERVEGFVSLQRFDHADMAEIFRFYDAANKAHYYTSDSADRDQKIIDGLIYEGITGFAFKGPQPSMEPMYHLRKDFPSPQTVDHFYTISDFEKDNAINVFGFTLIDTLTYVSPNGANVPIPYEPSQILVGEGVNTQNGNFTHYTKTSFSIPSIGLPLVFEHIYNAFSVIFQAEIIPLGPGWSHSYNSYISYRDNGLAVVWPNGRIDIYEKNGEIYEPKYKNVYDSLNVVSDTHFEIIKKDQIVYTYKRPAGASEGYPAVLTSIRDRNNNTITCQYESGGFRRLQKVIGPANRELNFTYQTDPQKEHLIKQVSDPMGRSISFDYDSLGNPVKFTDAQGRITEYVYVDSLQQDHLLKEIKLPRGNIITNEYEERRLKSQTGRFSGQFTFDYSPNITITTVTNGNDLQFEIYNTEFEGLMVPDKITGAMGFVIDLEFTDPNNPTKPVTIVDANGQTTTFAYDARGNVLQVQQPENTTHSFEYDEMNNLTSYTDPRGKPTQYNYDGNGNLIEIIDPLGRSTAITYKTTGLIETITDPMSHTTTYGYNNNGDATSIQDPLSNLTGLSYDPVGRLEQLTNPNSQTTTYSYSLTDRLLSVADASGTTAYTYDANDNLESVTSAKGQQTTLGYNALDLQISISNPLSRQTQFDYDDKGFMTQLTRPDNQTIDFGYDAVGRLATVSSMNATFTRDGNGNITGLTDANGSMSFNYDGLNRLKDYTDYYGNLMQYEYDPASNITKIIYPGNKAVIYAYYDDNRLQSVTTWNDKTIRYTYNADGTVHEIVYHNGVRCTYTYDAADRLTGVTTTKPNSEVIASYNFTLDPVGNITSEQFTPPLGLPPILAKNITLTYDLANRIQTAGTTSFSFDANGNMIAKNDPFSHSFTYDVENRLVQVSGASSANYTYDVFGNRRKAVRNGVIVKYVLDINSPMSQVLMETDDSNAPLNYYIYGLGLVARIKPDGTIHYYHYDSRGSIVAMTDGNADVTHAYVYGPFGELYDTVEQDANPFRYVGRFGVMDEGNGLYFMRARYYDPEIGRFLSEDPVWDVNLYAYAGNNPLLYIDPKGLGKFFPSWNEIKTFISESLTALIGSYPTSSIVGTGVSTVAGPVITTAQQSPDIVQNWLPIIKQMQDPETEQQIFDDAISYVNEGYTVDEALYLAYGGGYNRLGAFANKQNRKFYQELKRYLQTLEKK